MAKMGRPLIEINQDDFEKLCGMQCTIAEVAGFFDCSEDTIDRWCKRTYGETFALVYKKKSAKGKISVRRKQFQVAEAGNPTMLIWLGRQYLGQREYQEVALTSDTNEAIEEIQKYLDKKKSENR